MGPLAAMLPPRPFVGDLVRRTLLYWIGVRAFLYVFRDRTLFEDPNYALAVVVVVALALLVDARTRGMGLLLDDLGRGMRSVVAAPALGITLLEVVAFALTVSGAEG